MNAKKIIPLEELRHKKKARPNLQLLGSSVFSWRDVNDWAGVRALAAALSEQCETAEGRLSLESWIKDESAAFVEEGRLALAAVAEIASQHSLVGTGELLAKILLHEKTPSSVASIAAQRIRLSRLSAEARAQVWPSLQRWIEHWEREAEEDAVFAMRSVPVIGGAMAFDWLLGRLEAYTNSRLVWSIALMLTDWATGTFSSKGLQEKQKQQLWPLLESKYSSSGETATRVALLQCLGALTPTEKLLDSAALVVSQFLSGDVLVAAASVRAGKFLVRQYETKAATALRARFAEYPPESYDRFVALLHNIS